MGSDREVSPGPRLGLLLGDQLSRDSDALAALDPARDVVLMIETAAEATQVFSHRQRIALFLAAMRHHRDWLRTQGYRVDYIALADDCPDLASGLVEACRRHGAREVVALEAGEWRVEQALVEACRSTGIPLRLLADRHFYVTRGEFAAHARGRKQLRMEHFYRQQRRRHDVLMDAGEPAGGRWNFDHDNRSPLPRGGPAVLPPPPSFPPDGLTREVLREVSERFADHPGELEGFAWPVTREDALVALEDFIAHRLEGFGRYQDAMWAGEPFLWHSLLASCLNLKLLDPREVVAAAEQAWRHGRAGLAATEGFIRQVLGWREYIRGIYWLAMPEYAERNHFGHRRALPGWFWTGTTDLRCMAQVLDQTLSHGYAHHIQRLMVIGNFAVLAELSPAEVNAWFLAVYVDAVEWVQLPNTSGMALFADGGMVGSKPYVASGAYIRRMSNYCQGCRYDPALRTGVRACPFNRLYWRFLVRHRDSLGKNPRMAQVLRNLERWGETETDAILAGAEAFLAELDSAPGGQ